MGVEYIPEPVPAPKGWVPKETPKPEPSRDDGMGWEVFRWASLLWFLK